MLNLAKIVAYLLNDFAQYVELDKKIVAYLLNDFAQYVELGKNRCVV
jgi:hypothetical protein